MNLKDELIQLGEEQPELRENLRTILDSLPEESKEVKEEKPEEKEKKPNKKLRTPETEKGLIFSTCPEAKTAFEKVILPQIESRIDTFSFEDISQMVDEIELLGQSKNTELENSLIVHKPVSMNTRRFYQEIQDVFKEWLRHRVQGQSFEGDGENSNEEGKKEYNFNFS